MAGRDHRSLNIYPPFLPVKLIAVSWVYGVDNFMDDIKLMLGFRPFPLYYWRTVWKFLTPISVFVSTPVCVLKRQIMVTDILSLS